MGEIFSAMTPGVAIALAVGFFVRPLSVPLLIVAHILSGRMRYGRSRTHSLFVAAESVVVFLSGITLFTQFGFWDALIWWGIANGWAQYFSLLLLITIGITTRRAIIRGEPPEVL